MVQYATFGRRLWAFVLTLLLDLLVLWSLDAVTGGEALLPFAFWYLLHHVGLVVEGGTLGQRLAGLRVVRTDGGPVPVAHAFMREVVRLFGSLPPLGLGALWMLDQPERRTWHDLAAGTVVVRERAADAPAAPAWAAQPPWRAQAVAATPGRTAPEPTFVERQGPESH